MLFGPHWGFGLLYLELTLGKKFADESARASPPAACSTRTGTLAAMRQGGMQGSGEAITKRPVGLFTPVCDGAATAASSSRTAE